MVNQEIVAYLRRVYNFLRLAPTGAGAYSLVGV
jgi:hypothetical protein